jgi:hypothetical protein|tara:strand:- start:120 stop:350 length:231 start_codon:yes stop_codon:yes gene_type:complete
MDVLAILLALGVLFIGGVVFSIWNDLQNVDKLVWQNTGELKKKIRHLEQDIIDLNKTISELKKSDEEEPEEKNVSS